MRNPNLPILLAVAMALTACGTPGASSASASAAATPSVPAEDPAPLAAGPLEPGWYRSSHLEPTVAFRVEEDGWRVLFDENPDDGVALDFNGSDPFFGVARVPRVIEPDGTLGGVPDDLVAWLLAHPRLEAREIDDRTSLAGLPVRIVEFRPTGGDVTLYYHAGGNFHVPPDVTVRQYVMSHPEGDFVVTVGLGPAPAETEGAVEPILDSLQVLE